MAEILVLGAGMAGVAAALSLNARGHEVTLLDRRAPGQETSFGNAGVIQAEAHEPYAMPRGATLLGYALGRSNDVAVHLPSVPPMLTALWQYFRNSAPNRHALISNTYSQLIARAVLDHSKLISAADAGALLRQTGLGEIYTNARDLDRAAAAAQSFARRYGLAVDVTDGTALRTEEAALVQPPAGAILWRDSWSCSDPGTLVQAYATLFQARGGTVQAAQIRALLPTAAGWQVLTDGDTFEGEHVVVALGAWSPQILRPLGYKIPMVMKRGYHSHFAHPHPLTRPYVLMDQGVVLSSMQQGLRITSGAHLVGLDGPARFGQLDAGYHAAQALFDLGDELPDNRWQGTRPCLPGMLPLVGPASRHQGLWFDFGHGHQGFTLGPTTAELLAEHLEGAPSPLARALAPRG